jgi:hypothetical protein
MILTAVLLFSVNCFTAFAQVQLPDGAVAGLPKKLSVLDSDGNAANSTGEYFFGVEDMSPNTEYSKKIQIMNLRDDKAYHIYFYAQPISSEGEIDLEESCQAVFTLDGEEIFSGKVTGQSADGSINLSETPIDLGEYEPGKSRTLNCTVTWDGTLPDGFVDNGSRIVDKNGTTIVREKSGKETVSGEVTFRWIFYAVVDEDYVPPNTGLFTTQNLPYLIIMGVALAVIIALLILIYRKKNSEKNSAEKLQTNAQAN